MKLEKLIGERFKEKPADAVIESHALMIRGGYMKQVTGGIFSSYMALRRITRKIEQIIREEMDIIDGQEVLFPVVMPASLWQESGRYESVGPELTRFVDRNDSPMLLGMTHEEAAVHLVREYGQTYTKYPFMIYQIQTKFRDEARPRGGLIRVREFTMKDAYSFHTSQEDLEAYYERCFRAYERIFIRCGLPEVVSVASDSGMMGGKVAHEFMLLTPVGEDSIVICKSCDYRANLEAAASVISNESGDNGAAGAAGAAGAVGVGDAAGVQLAKVHTPGMKTIEDVCAFLKIPIEKSCKAVVYQKADSCENVVVFLRGDLEVSETKLRNLLKENIHPAAIDENSGLSAGYLGPIGLHNVSALFDGSLNGAKNLCCGANEDDYHYTGLSLGRDCVGVEYHDLAKAKDGGICPQCGEASLSISRGIEVGNIFQLGDKYTKSMNMKYVDESGEMHFPIMGCYGIGVGRLAASVCQASHDDHGPIWPAAIAPWLVHICCVRADDPQVRSVADGLYAQFLAEGVEVIYDDRTVSAGVMFSDADLLGVPVRVIVSPRNLKEGCCEVVLRNKTSSKKVKTDEVLTAVRDSLRP